MAGEASAAAAEVTDALALPTDPTAAAFFDVDNTIMRGASLFHFAVGLARRKFFTVPQIVGFGRRQVKFNPPNGVMKPSVRALLRSAT